MNKSNYLLYCFWDGKKYKPGHCESTEIKALHDRLSKLIRGRSEEDPEIRKQMCLTHVFQCSTDGQVLKLEETIHKKFDEYRITDNTGWKTEYFTSKVSLEDILQEIRDYATENKFSQVRCIYKNFYGKDNYEEC